MRIRARRCQLLIGMMLCALLVGCGTTRLTDTQRTATEQLLISNAVDQAVSQLDFRSLAGKAVFFDPQYLDGTVDRGYLVSSLRQHLLANGCSIQEDRTKATYVMEARSGGIGTDRHSLLIGVPQMTVPTFIPGQPSQIPEIPFAKKTDQNGIAKIAVYAYNRQTGQPVWQSGVVESISTAKDFWFLGAGPFQRGSIQHGTKFAGQPIALASFGEKEEGEERPLPPVVPVTQAASWPDVKGNNSRQVGDASGNQPAQGPLTIQGLIRAHLAEPAKTGEAGKTPEKKTPPVPTPGTPADNPPPKPPPPPPPTPNAGGQAETQPNKIMNSGLGGGVVSSQ